MEKSVHIPVGQGRGTRGSDHPITFAGGACLLTRPSVR